MHKLLAILVVIMAVASSAVGVAAKDLSLINENFEQDPAQTGWTFSPADSANPGKWMTGDAHSGTHFITAKEGKWESPKFDVTPLHYYKITFWAKGEPATYGHYYCLFFYNSKGEEIVADHYGSFDPSTTWQKHEFCVKAKVDAVAARIRFNPRDGGEISIDDVTLEPVTPAQVIAWEESLYKTLPPLTYTPPAGRFKLIPKTMKKLQQGGTVRIVMLGDSIINDTGSGPIDLLIGRHYPKAKIELITSVGGGKGTWYFRDENRVQSHIVDLKPDLLIIGGISGSKPDDNEECLHQMHAAGCNPEIMLMTGPVTPRFDKDGKPFSYTIAPDAESPRRGELVKEALDHNYAFMDIQSPLSQYEAKAGLTAEYIRRDPVHANDRCRALLAKIAETWFAPDQPAAKAKPKK